MRFQEIRDRANRVRTIPLEAVLQLSGARRDRYDKAKWHTQEGTVSVNGMKFTNWHRHVGGGGAIDLVMHLNHVGFKEALQWLGRHFPSPPEPPQPLLIPTAHLRLPPKDAGKLPRIKHYLVHHRGIAPGLIEPLIESGTLYADPRGNAVFVLLGNQSRPVGAELRGTSQRPWRGMAPGSRKELGYFSVSSPQPSAIVLCESAIDAISCFALDKCRLCVSTAGARANPAWLPSLLRQGHPVYCGFDADPPGDNMAGAMMALHPAVKRLRPSLHDWNDALRSKPYLSTCPTTLGPSPQDGTTWKEKSLRHML